MKHGRERTYAIRQMVGKMFLVVVAYSALHLSSCSESEPSPPVVVPPVVVEPIPFDINSIKDTYADVAPVEYYEKWGPYNVHDPSIVKDGEYFYCYNTDVAFGADVRPGIQIRRSKDLVDWEFYGWVFSGLPAKGSDFITKNGGTPFKALWAPYVMKVGNEFRLYYSLSSAVPRLSVIGLATSAFPTGPWTEVGTVVTSLNDAAVQTNAIDPTVVVGKDGKPWMYYGSAWDGIYILELDPATGLAAGAGKGRRIAQRGFTGPTINGNIEGPEIIYNSELDKYFLFIAYDWLATKYNVRVGRADTPEGPFYDFNGKDLNEAEDNLPMIIAPYKFNGHSGWQGVSHCSVFKDNGQYYIAHQGRPTINFYYMILHVRKLFWTKDGWPIASPERYAATEQTEITKDELAGAWERITLGYRVVPGYDKEQTSPDLQVAENFNLAVDGTINGVGSSTWAYRKPWIVFKSNDIKADSVYVERGRDWENSKACLIFTGLDKTGVAVWGKK